MTTAPLIKAVQTCRRQVDGLADNDAWRDFLRQVVGVDSLRAMTGPQLGRVMDALHAAGAPKRGGGGAGRRTLADDPQSRKIRAMWLALHAAGHVESATEASIAAWAGRMLGQTVEDLRWVRGGDRRRLIEALKLWCARVGVPTDV